VIRFQMLPRMGKHNHVHRDGRKETIRPGDVIKVHSKEDLGGALNKFKQLDPDTPIDGPKVGLVVVRRDKDDVGAGYDLVNEATGEALNDRPLGLSEAAEMQRVPPVPLVVTQRKNKDGRPTMWYDVVVTATGARLNAQALPLEEAKAIAAKGETEAEQKD